MAGKRKEMSKIKQVLQLHRDGMSNRKIGATLGLYKGTVNSYVNAAKADNKTLDELLKMEEPALEHRLCGGNPAYSDPRFDQLRQKLEYIDRELGRKHMTMFLLWEEYRMEHPQVTDILNSAIMSISFVWQDQRKCPFRLATFVREVRKFMSTLQAIRCPTLILIPVSRYRAKSSLPVSLPRITALPWLCHPKRWTTSCMPLPAVLGSSAVFQGSSLRTISKLQSSRPTGICPN